MTPDQLEARLQKRIASAQRLAADHNKLEHRVEALTAALSTYATAKRPARTANE